MNLHKPVLLKEALAGLAIKPAGIYVDCTFGRGGHSKAMMRQLGDKGRLIAIDRDPDAVAAAYDAMGNDPRFEIFETTFAQLGDVLRRRGIDKVDGILMDLGVSSPQFDDPGRGFTFASDGPLDMRMTKGKGQTAADWIAVADQKEISRVLFRYGEEHQAGRIAAAIVRARKDTPINTTRQLAEIIETQIPRYRRKHHPATKTFQAIRIFINKELEELELALAQTIDLLARDGRLCAISFHSLEDRIVKRFMRKHAQVDPVYAGLPHVPERARPTLRLVSKAIKASAGETDKNPRARSAVLRIAERL